MTRWFFVLVIIIVSLLCAKEGRAQMVTLNKKNATVQDILLDIYKQTKFYFYANTTILKKTKKVSINVNSVPLRTALDITFKGQPVKYALSGQTILITETKTIREAAVIIDERGDSAVQELDRVQIIGYGKTTKRLNTGNVSTVRFDAIALQPVTNPLLTLQGRVPGLLVTQTNGLPGSPVNVQIRGRNSIAASNNPLYIVDGVPFTSTPIQIIGGPNGDGTMNYGSPLNLINPDNIESIDILKDADATAIYGSRGANGVILITTKKAKENKLGVTVNIAKGFGKVTRRAPMMNTQQYLQVRRDGLKNSGLEINETNAPDLTVWDTTKYFDWQDWYMGGTAETNTGNLSVTFGNKLNKFLLSGTYHDETTVLPGDTKYRRGNIHVNHGYRSRNDKFDITSNIFWTGDRSKLNGSISAGLFQVVTTPPNYPIYDEQGKYYWMLGLTNSIAELESYYKSNANNLNANTVLKYSIGKGLSVRASMGYNRIEIDEKRVSPLASLNPIFGTPTSYSVFGKQHMNTYIFEPQINYTGKILGGKVELFAGSTYQYNIKDGNFAYVNFVDEGLLEHIKYGSVFFKDSVKTYYKYLSFFGRGTYNYNNRYIFNATLRRDGSSKFGPGKQFGNFFSLGAAWLFSNEEFMRDVFPVLSLGKLRISYGTTGNDGIADYGFMSTYANVPPYGNTPAASPSQPANDNYRWELSKKFEIGVETGFFRDRIVFSASWYNNLSTDQLLQYELPTMTGFVSYQANLPAEVVNRGLELELNTMNISKENFRWSMHANIFFPRNKLKSFPGIENSTYAGRYIVGLPLDNYQGVIFNGIDPITGQPKFVDVNNDGLIDSRKGSFNRQGGDLKFLEGALPSISAGIGNTISFKQFQLDFLFQYIKQKGYGLNSYFSYLGTIKNGWESYMRYWRKPGDNVDLPLPSALPEQYMTNFAQSSSIIITSDFLRLKNISLSYDINAGIIRSNIVKSFKVYIQAQNLITITNAANYDPETAANKYIMVPPLKMVQFGVKMTI